MDCFFVVVQPDGMACPGMVQVAFSPTLPNVYVPPDGHFGLPLMNAGGGPNKADSGGTSFVDLLLSSIHISLAPCMAMRLASQAHCFAPGFSRLQPLNQRRTRTSMAPDHLVDSSLWKQFLTVSFRILFVMIFFGPCLGTLSMRSAF